LRGNGKALGGEPLFLLLSRRWSSSESTLSTSALSSFIQLCYRHC
jgi:hypothetical protein